MSRWSAMTFIAPLMFVIAVSFFSRLLPLVVRLAILHRGQDAVERNREGCRMLRDDVACAQRFLELQAFLLPDSARVHIGARHLFGEQLPFELYDLGVQPPSQSRRSFRACLLRACAGPPGNGECAPVLLRHQAARGGGQDWETRRWCERCSACPFNQRVASQTSRESKKNHEG
jgi:hypothetical protein